MSLAVPSAIIAAGWYVVGSAYESPRQALVQGNKKKCLLLLNNAASVNGMPPLDLAECQLSVVDEREKAPPRDYGIKEALRRVMHPAHLQILVILSVVMFSLSFMEEGVFQWIIQYFKETNPDAESQLQCPIGQSADSVTSSCLGLTSSLGLPSFGWAWVCLLYFYFSRRHQV